MNGLFRKYDCFIDMTPLEYLSRYVVASRCRQRLNGVVFQRYASPDLSLKVTHLNNQFMFLIKY